MSEPTRNVYSLDKARLDKEAKDALKSGGGGDRFDPMEQRVAALEKRFDRFEAKLDGLVKDVAEVKGRVGAMPTAWQLLGMILAIMGASFAIIRFGLH